MYRRVAREAFKLTSKIASNKNYTLLIAFSPGLVFSCGWLKFKKITKKQQAGKKACSASLM